MKPKQHSALSLTRIEGAALDVSQLPSFGFSHRSLMWWGTLGLMAIEGTVFALAIGVYFYLRSFATRWPMEDQPPGLTWGTLNTVLLLGSLWPAHYAKRAAEALDLRRVRIGLALTSAAEVAVLGIRVLEFQTLNCRWDASAYGSIVWMLIGLHTLHLITDAWDTLVLTALLHTGNLEGKRYVDVSENSLYWYFVVWSWLPLYAVIYGAPRLG
jgi:heme/copper-type cytochrome/quinol oxidase subunit 3